MSNKKKVHIGVENWMCLIVGGGSLEVASVICFSKHLKKIIFPWRFQNFTYPAKAILLKPRILKSTHKNTHKTQQ